MGRKVEMVTIRIPKDAATITVKIPKAILHSKELRNKDIEYLTFIIVERVMRERARHEPRGD